MTPLWLALALASSAPALPSPAESAAQAVSASATRLDGELAQLDGGPLSRALEAAARAGRPLRLLLDPRQRPTRLQGLALAAISPTVQVRWSRSAGRPQRWLLADGALALAWDLKAGALQLGDAALPALSLDRFDRDWAQAARELPEGQRLDDQLKALPDPSEGEPHFIRRRHGAGHGAEDADPANPQPEGP